MFFYVSLVLVIVAAITLVIGLLNSGLPLVIVSIACSLLAGIFLILTVMRDRPQAEEAAPVTAPTPAAGPAPASGDGFPIADYDKLKVSEIVPLLAELDDDELETVRAHEESGKARATVLGRIDEYLAEGEEPEGEDEFPIADYDELKVSEIVPLLPELDDDELEVVRRREEAGKARASILARIDDLLGEEVPAPVPARRTAPRTPAAGKPAAKKTTTFPIADYDGLSVAEVTRQLRKLDAEALKQVRTYEKRKKGRKGVLDKIEAELASR